MNISLPDDLAEFVKAQVSSRQYSSASEVVREALQLLDQRDSTEAEKLQWLRKAWADGIDSGDAGVLDIDQLKAEVRQKHELTRKPLFGAMAGTVLRYDESFEPVVDAGA